MPTPRSRFASLALRVSQAKASRPFLALRVSRGVKIRKSVVEIAGRPLSVPSECDAFAQNNAGIIRCDGVPVLSWMIVADDAQREATQSKFAHMIQEHAGGRLDDERVPCVLEGMKTECRRLGMKDGSLYIGSAIVRGSIVVAMCLINGPGGLPKACAESFQVPSRE